MRPRYRVRVWKVTEYDVTLDVEPGDDIQARAIILAAQGHTTDFVDQIGVVDRGTFPVVQGITSVKSKEE